MILVGWAYTDKPRNSPPKAAKTNSFISCIVIISPINGAITTTNHSIDL